MLVTHFVPQERVTLSHPITLCNRTEFPRSSCNSDAHIIIYHSNPLDLHENIKKGSQFRILTSITCIDRNTVLHMLPFLCRLIFYAYLISHFFRSSPVDRISAYSSNSEQIYIFRLSISERNFLNFLGRNAQYAPYWLYEFDSKDFYFIKIKHNDEKPYKRIIHRVSLLRFAR